jgi:hypothetical protein
VNRVFLIVSCSDVCKTGNKSTRGFLLVLQGDKEVVSPQQIFMLRKFSFHTTLLTKRTQKCQIIFEKGVNYYYLSPRLPLLYIKSVPLSPYFTICKSNNN